MNARYQSKFKQNPKGSRNLDSQSERAQSVKRMQQLMRVRNGLSAHTSEQKTQYSLNAFATKDTGSDIQRNQSISNGSHAQHSDRLLGRTNGHRSNQLSRKAYVQSQFDKISDQSRQQSKSTPVQRSHMKAKLRYIKRKKERNRTILLALVVTLSIVVIGIMLAVVAGDVQKRPQLSFLNVGELKNTVQVEGYILRSEQVLTAPMAGYVYPMVQEGHKVDKAGTIMNIVPEDQLPQIEALNQIDDQIEARYQALLDAGLADLASSILNIHAHSLQNQLSRVRMGVFGHQLKDTHNELSMVNVILSQRQNALNRLNTNDEIIQNLKAERQGIQSELDQHAHRIISPISGLISYRLDGTTQSMQLQEPEQLSITEIKAAFDQVTRPQSIESTVNQGQAVCRIVDDIHQLLVLKINQKQPSIRFEKEDELTLNVHELNIDVDHCKVIKTLEDETDQYLILKTDAGVEALIGLSHITADLSTKRQTGLLIPKSALIKLTSDADTGRVRILKSGYVVEETVHVLAMDDDHYLIEGFDRQSAVVEGAIVVTNPGSVKEGEFIG